MTGRLKELINRGGEKIAPREIDEALLAHPAVRQAVAFAVQHPTLGENIAAAVVLAFGSTLEEGDLIDHALSRLPFFKVPARILLLPDIPKGPTGKIQRIGLATRLAAELAPASEAPKSVVEARICAVFSEVLGLSAVGRRDNFFALGGDSLRATRALTRLRSDFGLDLPAALIFQKPTAARLAASLEALITEANDLASDPELDELARSLATLSPEERTSLLGPSDKPVT